MSDEFTGHFTYTKLNLNESCLEICSWARSSAWLERSTDNRKVMCSNHIGPIFVISGFVIQFETIVKLPQSYQMPCQIEFWSF